MKISKWRLEAVRGSVPLSPCGAEGWGEGVRVPQAREGTLRGTAIASPSLVGRAVPGEPPADPFARSDGSAGTLRPTAGEAGGSGFTLVECLVAMAIIGTALLAMYAGITTGFGAIQMARENLRATQILLEKTEVIRLCTWDQINSNGFIPTTFAVSYDAMATNGVGAGPTYRGRITITNAPSSLAYQAHMREVTVELDWETRGLPRHRRISTYVSKFGIQNYLLN